jgi:small neutral amino acid transporter SnatA (MarC family)
MNTLLAIVAYMAALNPARTRLGIPENDNGGARMGLLGPGTAIGVLGLVGIAAISDPILDAVEISPETFRIAAGFVLVIVATWMMFVPIPTSEPVPDGFAARIWPVAYPRVISPETITLTLSIGASDGLGLVLPGLGLAAGVLVALGPLRAGPMTGRAMASLGRVAAVILVVVGVWLAIQGVREV